MRRARARRRRPRGTGTAALVPWDLASCSIGCVFFFFNLSEIGLVIDQ